MVILAAILTLTFLWVPVYFVWREEVRWIDRNRRRIDRKTGAYVRSKADRLELIAYGDTKEHPHV